MCHAPVTNSRHGAIRRPIGTGANARAAHGDPEGGVPVSIQWETPTDDFDMYIYDSANKQVASSAGTADPKDSHMIRRRPAAQPHTSAFDAGTYYGIRSKGVVTRVSKKPLLVHRPRDRDH